MRACVVLLCCFAGCGGNERLTRVEDPLGSRSVDSAAAGVPASVAETSPSVGAGEIESTSGEAPATTGSVCSSAVDVADCATNQGYQVYRWQGPSGPTEVVALGVYQTRSDHSGGSHPEGSAQVTDSRQSPHVLLLSSYEPTAWTVRAAAGSGLVRVVVAGYYPQRVTVSSGVRVDNFSGSSQGFACAYSIPYNGGGCDPANMHQFVSRVGLPPVGTFAGCYRATTFAVTDCAKPSGWQPSKAVFNRETSGCSGDRFVRYNSEYRVWVGAELCSATAYKLYLSKAETGPFDPITDSGGHGQDHCELLVPGFRLPSDDDVTSGGCVSCSVTPWELWSVAGGNAWVRSKVGEPFQFGPWTRGSQHTSSRYSCGVSIP
jgi:hypothetical protein